MIHQTSPEAMSASADAVNLLTNFTKAQAAASAFLRFRINSTLKVLEEQPAHRNDAYAMDFRTIRFDDGGKVSAVIRGWRTKWNLYIIPGLNGLIEPTGERGEGQFIPFENFLPKLEAKGVDYVDLVTAITELHESVTKQCKEDGQEN
jgi:hypothetical protein